MKIVVHKFRVGDVEDPQLYAGAPLYEWEHSEVGQWVMKHSKEQPTWSQYTDPYSYVYSGLENLGTSMDCTMLVNARY